MESCRARIDDRASRDIKPHAKQMTQRILDPEGYMGAGLEVNMGGPARAVASAASHASR